MGKKRQTQTQRVLGVLMIVFLLIGIIPGVALGAATDLSWLTFVSSSDSTLVAGETSNINLRLWDTVSNPFSGSVNAFITDANGNQTFYSTSGSQGSCSVSNVTLDTPGNYSLYVTPTTSSAIGVAEGTITVVNAVPTITGSLLINTNNTLKVKLTDPAGNLLARRAVTLDGSAVGAMTQSCTTLSDGTFSFQMNPSSYGNVSIIHAGHVIGTIPVLPAFTQNARIGGTAEDNVALSIAVAKSGWTEGARFVILARDDEFPDAMTAVPLSKSLNAPILMTGSAILDDRTLAEMRSLGATGVYIVGGTGAISQTIQDNLKSNGFSTARIAGQERYDTAAMISSFIGANATHTVYIVNGYALPDAVAASAFAAEQGIPILLTGKDEIPTSTLDALANLNASNVVLLGGTGVISTQVENALRSKYAVQRWGGNDRYDTQNIIFQNLLNTQTPQSPLYFASGLIQQDDVTSGKPYADALLTAALAAKTGGFVAMLPPNTLPSSLNYFLLYNKGYISKTAVVGNYSAVSRDLEQQVGQILNR